MLHAVIMAGGAGTRRGCTLIDRVERLPRPEPNVDNLLSVLRRERPERVPLFELKLDEEVMAALLGKPKTGGASSAKEQRL